MLRAQAERFMAELKSRIKAFGISQCGGRRISPERQKVLWSSDFGIGNFYRSKCRKFPAGQFMFDVKIRGDHNNPSSSSCRRPPSNMWAQSLGLFQKFRCRMKVRSNFSFEDMASRKCFPSSTWSGYGHRYGVGFPAKTSFFNLCIPNVSSHNLYSFLQKYRQGLRSRHGRRRG